MATGQRKIHILVIEVPMDDEPGDGKFEDQRDEYEKWLGRHFKNDYKSDSPSDTCNMRHYYRFTGPTPLTRAKRAAARYAKRLKLPVIIRVESPTVEQLLNQQVPFADFDSHPNPATIPPWARQQVA